MSEQAEIHHHENEHLHIFVNRIRFERKDGVREVMTGGQIADLVHVPHNLAVIKRLHGSEQIDVSVGETLTIKDGEHFLVTRSHVDGG